MSVPIISTTIHLPEEGRSGYVISTIYRRCSAAAAPDLWYYETMIWTLKDGKRDRHLDTYDVGVEEHMEIVRKILAGWVPERGICYDRWEPGRGEPA